MAVTRTCVRGTFSVSRVVDGETVRVRAAAVVDEVDALGTHLRLEREITIDAAAATIAVEDLTTNLGGERVAAPLLYHLNFGAPFWSPGARLDVAAHGVTPRDEAAGEGIDRWALPPSVAPDAAEWVFEHVPDVDDDGWARASVHSPPTGRTVVCTWDAATLPRLHQWSHRRAGVYALAVEPANCSTLGRAADRALGELPHLAAGEQRRTRLRLTATRV